MKIVFSFAIAASKDSQSFIYSKCYGGYGGCRIMGSLDYGSMVLYGWRVQAHSWPYSCHLLT